MNELNLNGIYAEYERSDGRGLSAYHPLLLMRLLLYGYSIGVTSSRAIEKATYDNVAFRYLAADQHPDHDTIASFRQEHLETLAGLFLQALRLCEKAGANQGQPDPPYYSHSMYNARRCIDERVVFFPEFLITSPSVE